MFQSPTKAEVKNKLSEKDGPAHTQTDKNADRQTDRQTHTHTHTHTYTCTHTHTPHTYAKSATVIAHPHPNHPCFLRETNKPPVLSQQKPEAIRSGDRSQ